MRPFLLLACSRLALAGSDWPFAIEGDFVKATTTVDVSTTKGDQQARCGKHRSGSKDLTALTCAVQVLT